MLQFVHSKIQGVVAWVVAIVITIVFSLWGVQNYLHTGADVTVATVNGKKISKEQLQLTYEQLKQYITLKSGHSLALDQETQIKLKQEALEQLIQQRIISQAQVDMGMGIPKKHLVLRIQNIPEFQVDGRFSPEKYHQIVHRMYRTEQDFLNQVRANDLHMQLETGIANSDFVLPYEYALFEKIFQQRRDFSYLTIPIQLPQSDQITPEAVIKYYNEHQQDFILPEQVSIQYVELEANKLAPPNPSSQQLQQYYKNHISSFSTLPKWQVTKILSPLPPKADSQTTANAHKKIQEIAKLLQDKKELNTQNSELKITTSWITQKELPASMVTHTIELGQISAPFRTPDGYNLIKILAEEPSQAIPYDQIAKQVAEAYKHQHLTQAFTTDSDKLSDLVYTHPDTLEPAAKELGLSIKTSELITNNDKTGIFANPKVVNTTFSDIVLKQRYNSNLIEITPGKVIVLRIKEHILEKLQPLEQVKHSIIEKLRRQEASEAAHKLAQKILEDLKIGKTTFQIANQYNLTWHNIVAAEHDQSGKNTLSHTAFTLKHPTANNISATIVDQPETNSYAVLYLTKVYDATTDSKQNLDAISRFLPRLYGQNDFKNFITALMMHAKIKRFDSNKTN